MAAQQEKAELQTQRETTRLYELPRLAEQVDSEKARADWLSNERSRLQARVDELEQTLRERDDRLAVEELRRSESLRKGETERRRRLEGEALRAIEETDRELVTERAARKDHETARVFMRSKIDQLQKALHREQDPG